jgi:hypothetical protein
LNRQGFVLLDSVFSLPEMKVLTGKLSAALDSGSSESILRSRGKTYGSRNLLESFPDLLGLMTGPALRNFLGIVLGHEAGIVRALFFDKPPDRSWSLPWHKDRTIAVKRNDLASKLFHKPTLKAGVPHVEAPTSLLEKMLTLRIHLDAMTGTNGPLCVIPGSHREPPQECLQPEELHADAGDVLAMRPLISHSSTISRPGSTSHRRVIHIELAAQAELADGYEWYSFIPINKAAPFLTSNL